MKTSAFSSRLHRLQLPAGMLIMLLQRTPAPVMRVLDLLENVVLERAPLILRSSLVATAMGAYNSVAGATVFNVTPATPSSGAANATFTVTGTTGTALSVGISVSGAPGNPKSWSVKSTTPLPAGLSVTGGNPVNVVAPYKMTIAGTPTAVGTTSCTVTAWDGLNGTGGNSAKITVTFNISSGGPANTAPSITSQPSGQTITVGSSVTFTVAASGTPTPTYQWNKGGVPIGGATGTSYTIAAVANVDAGTYTATATNVAGTATSNGATLTVQTAPPPNTAPAITTPPSSQTVTTGNPVTFTVAASGNPTPTYQWNKGGVPIGGATSTTYTIAAVASGDAGTYTATATNSAGTATSSGATLTVQAAPPTNVAPTITTQPSSQSVTTGGSVTFTVAASGTPTPTYQWSKGGVAIGGATSSSYTIAAAASGDAGSYTATATNVAGTATSSSATLTVQPAPPVNTAPSITMQPVSQTVTAGDSVTFTVGASGNPVPTYQWSKGGVSIAGATSASYSIASAAAGDAGNYTVLVSNSAGNVTSSGAVLVVGSAPQPPTPPPPAATFFSYPSGITFVGPDGLYVSDSSGDTVQKVTTAGDVTLLAGTSGSAGTSNGTGAAALFNQPGGVVAAGGGVIYVADTANAMIRRVGTDGSVTTFAGSSSTRGNVDGVGTAATFGGPLGIAIDSAGNLYVADAMNHTIRKITSAGTVSTLAGSAGVSGFADGTGAAARFNYPAGLAVDAAGNVYVADQSNNLIRKITPAGVVTTLAGLQGVSGFSDGAGSLALFNQPDGVVLDSAGNVYVADTGNSTIRKITPAGVVSTLAGLPAIGGNQDGTGSGAMFNLPRALTIDGSGNLYVADTGNASIRKVTPAGVVTTLTLRQGSTSSSSSSSSTGGGSTSTPSGVSSSSASNGNGAGSMGGWFGAALGLLALLRWPLRRTN